MVGELQASQALGLIQKVAHQLEPLVGQWVGSGGFAFEVVNVVQLA